LKAIVDRAGALGQGLSAIRTQFQLPGDFPPEGEEAAKAAARQPLSDHADRTSVPFVTLDPLSSTDLDQALAIDPSGGDLILRYAIADIGWFVPDGGPVDLEAWHRGETLYLPDGKISLYPTVLCEGAASLLPDGDRPAIVFAVRVDANGAVGAHTAAPPLRVTSAATAPTTAYTASRARTDSTAGMATTSLTAGRPPTA